MPSLKQNSNLESLERIPFLPSFGPFHTIFAGTLESFGYKSNIRKVKENLMHSKKKLI